MQITEQQAHVLTTLLALCVKGPVMSIQAEIKSNREDIEALYDLAQKIYHTIPDERTTAQVQLFDNRGGQLVRLQECSCKYCTPEGEQR